MQQYIFAEPSRRYLLFLSRFHSICNLWTLKVLTPIHFDIIYPHSNTTPYLCTYKPVVEPLPFRTSCTPFTILINSRFPCFSGLQLFQFHILLSCSMFPCPLLLHCIYFVITCTFSLIYLCLFILFSFCFYPALARSTFVIKSPHPTLLDSLCPPSNAVLYL